MVSRSVADKLTVTFASDSDPEMPPPPDGDELAAPFDELIYCINALLPPVGSVAVAAWYPAPVVGPVYN